MTIKKILKAIGCPHLTLERAGGMYYLFVYWNPKADKFNCRRVNVKNLSDLPSSAWMSIGRDFSRGMTATDKAHSITVEKTYNLFFIKK